MHHLQNVTEESVLLQNCLLVFSLSEQEPNCKQNHKMIQLFESLNDNNSLAGYLRQQRLFHCLLRAKNSIESPYTMAVE